MGEAYLCGHALTPDAVKLWQGTWASGNLTVTKTGGSAGCTGLGDISDYNFLAVIWYSSVTIFCRNIEKKAADYVITGGTVRHGDSYGTGVPRFFVTSFYRSGNILSCVDGKPPLIYTSDLGTSWAMNQPITEIWGLGKVK